MTPEYANDPDEATPTAETETKPVRFTFHSTSGEITLYSDGSVDYGVGCLGDPISPSKALSIVSGVLAGHEIGVLKFSAMRDAIILQISEAEGGAE